ncbi:hypothetical protein ABGB17_16625 [Sphaerisporangium sp. B11E5]|uniref:hypothetical protein n=1 Tax=Sphaerisporangium sp. B11E5 TaxID=3153563 RepID=UPI00325C71ED
MPTEIDNTEMRSLLAAVHSGYDAVRGDLRLAERRHAAMDAHGRAHRHLAMMRVRLRAEKVAEAASEYRAATARAALGGRRPFWLRAIRWPVIVVVGAFDVWYFTQVFRYLTSYTGDAETGRHGGLWETFVPLVPGVVLAVVLALSSVLLLSPLHAWRERAFRPAPSLPESAGFLTRARYAVGRGGGRLLRLIWWSLPIVFVGFVLAVVAIWAALRALNPTPPEDGYPLPSVVMLILMLSIGAIVTKIAADDPVAERAGVARRRLAMRRMAYHWQARRADRLIRRYESAWSDMRTLRDELVGVLRLKMLSAWEVYILRTRALHRRAGNVTPLPVAQLVGPERTEEDVVLPEFENVPQPRPELGPLHEICRLITDEGPEDLWARKQELDNEFVRQLTEVPEPPVRTVSLATVRARPGN